MNARKESFCLNVMDNVLRNKFAPSEYSLNGKLSSAICLDHVPTGWKVFESERNAEYNAKTFPNIVEACLDFLGRMSTHDRSGLKEEFLDRIITGTV